jgi:predicted nuclease with TOPRIM domain
MQALSLRFTLCFCLVAAGCAQSALMTLQRENIETEQRIAAKGQQLEDLENENRILREDQESLLEELDTQQMTLNQLSTRLDRLQRENARIRADTDRQRKEKQKLDTKIQQYRDEIDALQSNDQLSAAEKREKIEELKEKIRAYLKMGLR